ncbi:HD-GYP domain-containing protein [Thiomicrorhabdus lithotrophica]|uniref:HD-GYP domain-containing protein n=1 Tax=Thiomicrorhabdus lithotrophica TaxID=2949997 RepID=A0ABY8CD60_9GAMM|nr:HD-GYP domain-containing protein [Thiomicrorhabdus lithotrophica]WEJ62707.1 HD-GYP domain-containing protein [Thiomicrorhabdus lithotrophica]
MSFSNNAFNNSLLLEQDFDAPLLLSEVIGALSYALDLTEGQPPGHSIRCCWIGMHIGQTLGLSQQDQWNLYYTLLLKDAGCSSNAARLYELYGGDDRQAKKDFKFVDNESFKQVSEFVLKHTGVGEGFLNKTKRLLNLAVHGEELATELMETRCERGADIAIRLGFTEEIANGIRYLDEHWNGNGKPYRLAGNEIPLTSQIALLAQVADVFFQLGGKVASLNEVVSRSNTWFDPELVKIYQGLETNFNFWNKLAQENMQQEVQLLEPSSFVMTVSDKRLDDITAAFGMIVDSKSSYTFNHSSRVALYTDKISDQLGFSEVHRKHLKRGAMLHDIGKLGVSNSILDKPGKLTNEEREMVEKHAYYTEKILSHLSPFSTLAKISGAHHERLDGKGYPYGLSAEEITLDTRIITTADIFDAITAKRPYRDAVPVEKTIKIMESECGTAIDEVVLEALKSKIPELDLD